MATIRDAVVSDGALVTVEVGVSRSYLRRLRAAGRPIPQPVRLTALIDTGAEVTCIDGRAARKLQLATDPNFAPVNVPAAGGMTFSTVADVRLTVLHPSGHPADHLVVHDLSAAEIALRAFRIDVLIGRDVLALCRFDYDGRAGVFTLEY